jgi:hypothetical protein
MSLAVSKRIRWRVFSTQTSVNERRSKIDNEDDDEDDWKRGCVGDRSNSGSVQLQHSVSGAPHGCAREDFGRNSRTLDLAVSEKHPNGLTRVKILEAPGEGADLAVAEKHPDGLTRVKF